MRRIGYDVINVGERELASGVDEFLSLIAGTGLAFTNANFVYRDNGEQLFAPFVLKEYEIPSGRRVTVGFIGLNAMNSATALPTAGGRVVIMRDPVEAMKLHMPLLRQRADLVVLLANMSLRDLSTVLGVSPGVDLVLASYGARLSPGGSLERIGEAEVLYSGDQGKRLGEVRIAFGGEGRRASFQGGHVWLTRRYPADAGLQSLIDQTVARVNEINRTRATRAAPSARPAGAVAAAGDYRTASSCVECHQEASAVFEQSAHARAFLTLIKANQDFNPECVRCHVTGFDQPGGFVNARQTPDLANVQCEACHGSAVDHLADTSKPYGDVRPRQCFVCHTKENSPDFVFFKYWDMIKH